MFQSLAIRSGKEGASEPPIQCQDHLALRYDYVADPQSSGSTPHAMKPKLRKREAASGARSVGGDALKWGSRPSPRIRSGIQKEDADGRGS